MKLKALETTLLNPGTLIMAGSLQFLVERFNVGAVAKLGNRARMEDTYVIAQDLGLDSALKSSLYVVMDGHGGDWCAKFLQAELVKYVVQ